MKAHRENTTATIGHHHAVAASTTSMKDGVDCNTCGILIRYNRLAARAILICSTILLACLCLIIILTGIYLICIFAIQIIINIQIFAYILLKLAA